MTERVTRSEQRLAEIDAGLVQGELSRGRVEQELGTSSQPAGGAGGRSGECPGAARPLAGAGGARGREVCAGATERLERAGRTRAEAEERVRALIEELTRLDADTASVAAQQAEWLEARAERRVALQELELASAAAETLPGRCRRRAGGCGAGARHHSCRARGRR